MIRFTAEVRDNWVNALLSGNYEQGEGQLTIFPYIVDEYGRHVWDDTTDGYIVDSNKATKYCCLGVLRKLHPELEDEVSPEEGILYGLSESFVEGLSSAQQDTLASMNDGNERTGVRKHTFPEIAEYIKTLPVAE